MLVFGLLAPPRAAATQVVDLSLDQMVERCDVAVWGQVIDVRSERMPEAPGRIHTVVTIRPLEVLGADAETLPGDDVVISAPGGRDGRFAQLVPGTPEYTVGQELVVLATRQPRSRRLKVIGLALGQYRVERTATAATVPGAATAVSDRQGLGILRRSPHGILEEHSDSSTDRRSLDDLLNSIRAGIAARSRR